MVKKPNLVLTTKTQKQKLLASLVERAFHHAPGVEEIVVPLFRRMVEAADREVIVSRSRHYGGFGQLVRVSFGGRPFRASYSRRTKKIRVCAGRSVIAVLDNKTPVARIDRLVHQLKGAA